MTDSRDIIDRFFVMLEKNVEICNTPNTMNFIRRIETNKFVTLKDKQRITLLIDKFDKLCKCTKSR